MPSSRLALATPIALSLGLLPVSAQQDGAVFNAPNVVLGSADVPFQRLLDFDGDGDLDAFGMRPVGSGDAYRTAVYDNDGQGVFALLSSDTSGRLPAIPASFPVETADLDGDGRDEAVFGAWNEVHIRSFADDGTSTDTIYRMSAPVVALALGDLDGDGLADIVAGTQARLDLIFSDGSLGAVNWSPNQETLTTLRVADLDADGSQDILFATAEHFGILFGKPGPSFQQSLVFSVSLTSPTLDVGDVNGDGLLDVAAFGAPSEGAHQVFLGNGGGSFTPGPVRAGGPAQFLCDVDGDGDLDGVGSGGAICAGCPPSALNLAPSDFEISLNDGFGIFAPSFALHGVGASQLAGVADLDGDGDVDLIAGRAVYFARGPISRPNPTSADALPVRPSKRDLADVDGDGDVDLGLSLVSTLQNDGTGSFRRVGTQVPPAPAGTLFLGPGYPGDFDGDGDVDLLVEHDRVVPHAQPLGNTLGSGKRTHSSTPRPGALIGMRLLTNDGTGRFTDAGPAGDRGISFSLGSLEARHSLTFDLDGDGTLDLVTVSSGAPAESRVWRNDGAGHFRGPIVIAGSRVVHAADLDGDGTGDLIVSRPTAFLFGDPTDTLEVLRGVPGPGGALGFQLVRGLTSTGGVFFFPSSGREELAFGDLFGAGFTDMVLLPVNFAGPLLFWDRQAVGAFGYLGQPSLDTASVLATHAGAAIGDLDGDGLNDALLGPWGGGELVEIHDLLRKQAPLTLNFSYAAAQVLPHGVLVDLDGDGDLDLLGTEVILNRTAW